MLLHCSEIREAYKATLADWNMSADAAMENMVALVEHTAALASVFANRTVAEDHVRNVVSTFA